VTLNAGLCDGGGDGPGNEGGPEDPCEGFPIREVWLEVDVSPSVSDPGDWLDTGPNSELRKAFRACCTEFDSIRIMRDGLVPDYPEDLDDCLDKGQRSWDSWYMAGMHLILAKKIEGVDVLGFTWYRGNGSAMFESSSWVFVERIDSLLTAFSSHASRKALSTNVATHELGHHRANLEEACVKMGDQYFVNPSHTDEYGDPDGDCVMSSPLPEPGGISVSSICGSGKSQLYDIYFCYECREAIKDVVW